MSDTSPSDRSSTHAVGGSDRDRTTGLSSPPIHIDIDKLELMGPGVVPADQWHPSETTTPRPDESRTFMYGAIARKP